MSGADDDDACVVGTGDCILRIAEHHGVSPEAVWEHPANASLRQARPDPTALVRGDRVVLPARQQKQAQGATDRRHEFVRKVQRVKLRLIFEHGRDPLVGATCTFDIEGERTTAQTDARGLVEVSILPTAVQGTVRVSHQGREFNHKLEIGDLDVHTSVRGALQRLRNLGYFHAGDVMRWVDQISVLLSRFQQVEGLPVTTELDAATAAKLREVHGG